MLQNTENPNSKMWRNMVPLAKYGSLLYHVVIPKKLYGVKDIFIALPVYRHESQISALKFLLDIMLSLLLGVKTAASCLYSYLKSNATIYHDLWSATIYQRFIVLKCSVWTGLFWWISITGHTVWHHDFMPFSGQVFTNYH